MKKGKILIVDDNELSRQNLSELMLSSGYDVKAVEDGRLGPDDYIWSPSFGTEWRKASTMTGLFPPPEPPPPFAPASGPHADFGAMGFRGGVGAPHWK